MKSLAVFFGERENKLSKKNKLSTSGENIDKIIFLTWPVTIFVDKDFHRLGWIFSDVIIVAVATDVT